MTTSILKNTLPRPSEAKEPVAMTPSVKFSAKTTCLGTSRQNSPRKRRESKVLKLFGNVYAPLNRCRNKTLKRVHCRTVLVAICALVVIECVCVLSELMVDLQGIKFRFENEASEINKFVAHFRNIHPEAFDHVDIRSTKDFFQLLKSASVHRTSSDVISRFACQLDKAFVPPVTKELHAPCFQSDKVKPPSLGNTPVLDQNGAEKNHASNHNSMTGNNRERTFPRNKAERTAGVENKNDKILSKPDFHLDAGHDTTSNLGPKGNRNTVGKKCISNCLTTKETNFNEERVAAHLTTSDTINTEKISAVANPTPTQSSQIFSADNEGVHPSSTSPNPVDIATHTGRHKADVNGNEFENGNTMNQSIVVNMTVSANSTSVLSHGTFEDTPQTGTDGKASSTNTSIMNRDKIILDSTGRELGVNRTESEGQNVSLPADQHRPSVGVRTSTQKSPRIRRSAVANNKTSSSINSLSNLFVLEINSDIDNFFMIAELLPERVKDNETEYLKYKDEYKKIYTTSKALHFTSLSILGIMVIETIIKLFCTGCSFFKKKLEVFDALIVVSSFALDVMFLDSRWYETGKDATALLVLLLPWRVVRIVNSFLMTVKHKHHLQMMNLKRGKKKAEIKMTKLQTLLTEIRRDIQLLTNLCRFHDVDENSINACLYGKGRRGVTLDAMTSCVSLMLISTLGKDTQAQEDDVYSTVIEQVLNDGKFSANDQGRKEAEEAALDAAIAMEEKIEAKRKSRRPSRLKRALLKRSYTIPRRCASLEIPEPEEGASCSNNVFYIMDSVEMQARDSHSRPQGLYFETDNERRPTSNPEDVLYVSEDGGSARTESIHQHKLSVL